MLKNRLKLEEKFYILIIEEVRAQPGLGELVPLDLDTYGESFAGMPLQAAITAIDAGQPISSSEALSFAALDQLGPPRGHLVLDGYRVETDPERRDEAYRLLCQHALLDLLWNDVPAAEEKVNLAKYFRDDWAFAHFLYGLLRGLTGAVGHAHFELYLATHRETLPGARQRIERALRLVR
jgi:hypothetical protein